MSIAEAYNQWANQYDSNENKTRDLDRVATQKTLGKYAFDRVLELGCGTGKNTVWLLEQEAEVIGVDFSEGMLKKARQKIQSPKARFLRADITEVWSQEIPEVDLATCSLILEHIADLDFIFQQAYQKIKRGGHFFICELHPFKQYIGSKARYDTEHGVEELEVYIHHISEFVRAGQQNGFTLVELKEWFDEGREEQTPPRLLSLVFRK
ncbi:MAG: class I SAM-dependent methyltransferase [Saprospiraceae bacterium]|nr:class I SAM-dependent methyltransferase [Saprospiraceae bacterium]